MSIKRLDIPRCDTAAFESAAFALKTKFDCTWTVLAYRLGMEYDTLRMLRNGERMPTVRVMILMEYMFVYGYMKDMKSRLTDRFGL